MSKLKFLHGNYLKMTITITVFWNNKTIFLNFFLKFYIFQSNTPIHKKMSLIEKVYILLSNYFQKSQRKYQNSIHCSLFS